MRSACKWERDSFTSGHRTQTSRKSRRRRLRKRWKKSRKWAEARAWRSLSCGVQRRSEHAWEEYEQNPFIGRRWGDCRLYLRAHVYAVAGFRSVSRQGHGVAQLCRRFVGHALSSTGPNQRLEL